MKKILLLFSLTFGLFIFSQAQNPITLSWNGKTLGDTLVILDSPGNLGEFIFHAIIYNNTNNGMNIKVARNNIYIVENTENSFCWPTTCWSPLVDTSSDYGFIPAGGHSDSSEFSGHYRYNDGSGNHMYGTSIVKYSFFNMDNPEIINTIIVKYSLGYVGIKENKFHGAKVSDIFPNPVSNVAMFNYNLGNNIKSGEVKIINLLGKVVKSIPLITQQGLLKIDVSDLHEGIYFYTISLNNNIFKTKKFIIKK